MSGPYRIEKEYRFEAAHHLTGLPPEHQCSRPHGHSYRVVVVLESDTLVIPGFVADFAELSPVKAWIDSTLDHRDLNEVLGPWWVRAGLDYATAPTSEHMAEMIYTLIKESHIAGLPYEVTASLAAVRLSETATSWAEFRP